MKTNKQEALIEFKRSRWKNRRRLTYLVVIWYIMIATSITVANIFAMFNNITVYDFVPMLQAFGGIVMGVVMVYISGPVAEKFSKTDHDVEAFEKTIDQGEES